MPLYRVTYEGLLSVTFIGSTPGNAAWEIWKRYRDTMQGGETDFLVGALFVDYDDKTKSIAVTTVTMNTKFSEIIQAEDAKAAVSCFAASAIDRRMIPLGFDPGCVSVEFVDGQEKEPGRD